MSAGYPDLDGAVVIVTGGASGIGAEITTRLVEAGSVVVILDRDAEAGAALADTLAGGSGGGRAHMLPCDLTEVERLPAVVARILREHGAPAGLVNNAGNDSRTPMADLTPEIWDGSLDINLKQATFLSKAVAEAMIETGIEGAICNITSLAWLRGHADMAAYASAKAGLVGLTRSLGWAYGGHGIRVNAVAPGLVMTERQRRLWHDAESERKFIENQAIKRPLPARAIANAVTFLLSTESSMITRQVLRVDGGVK